MAKYKDYQNWKIEDIIKWCQENNQVEWLKETAKKKTPYKVYPRVDGKADKTQEPKIEMRPISFVQLKTEFLTKFMNYEKAEKKVTMYDLIENL